MSVPLDLVEWSPDYCGVIAGGAALRLIVDVRGSAFVLQSRKRGRRYWKRRFGFKSRAELSAFVRTMLAAPPVWLQRAAGDVFALPRAYLPLPVVPRQPIVSPGCLGDGPVLPFASVAAGDGLAVFPGVVPERRPLLKRGPLKVKRPSLFDSLRLKDGRLAWPVAQSLGLGQATFRARLKRGLSVDRAVFAPVAKPVRWSKRPPEGRR